MDGMETEVLEPIESGGSEQPAQEQESEYGPKSSREYSQWLKGLRDETNPENPANKFAKLSRENHARLFQLNGIEPRGIDGVREKYAALEGLEFGETKGFEALGQMQDRIREYADTDEKLAQGDPSVLEAFGDDFNEGLAKLAPHILDRIEASNPEAYSAAVFPHLMKALMGSELVPAFNKAIDVLNEQPPRWMTPDQKTAWTEDKMARVYQSMGTAAQWFGAQQKKLEGTPNVPRGTNGASRQGTQTPDKEAVFRKEQQEHHWNTNISPQLDKHAESSFKSLFAPFDKRLRLPEETKKSLMNDFSKRVSAKAMKNPVYTSQITRYRSQNNPNPSAVVNLAKVEFDKHAKTVLQALIDERYKPFLNGRQQTQAQPAAQIGKKGPVAPNIQFVSVRPAESEINHKARTLDQIHEKIFPLKNGKVVQVRA